MQSLSPWGLRSRQSKQSRNADPLMDRAIASTRELIPTFGSGQVRRVATRRLRRIELARARNARPWRAIAVGFLALSTAYGLWSGGQAQKLYDQAHNGIGAIAVAAGLGAQSIVLEGQKHITDGEISRALGVDASTVLLTFDTAAAKERLEKLSWIKHAQVMRLLPSTLQVVIEEREPFAIWQKSGKTYVVDSRGAVLAPAVPDAYPKLPIVVGEGAAEHAAELLQTLSMFSDLDRQLLAAIRVGDRRWNLKLKSGMDIMLPDDNVGQALTALTELDRERGLLDRNLASIDMRLGDRITLRGQGTAPEPAGGPTGGAGELPTASTSASAAKGNT